jgi:hypothetical protein
MSSGEFKTLETKIPAIIYTKALWKAIRDSRLSKTEYFEHVSSSIQYEKHNWLCNCPLCDWVSSGNIISHMELELKFGQDCICNPTDRVCPFYEQYHAGCYELGFRDIELPSKEWLEKVLGLKEI